MNKAFIFDLDGVLVDSKDIHFNALNLALADVDAKYVITRSEQDSIYEGLTTRSKLEILKNQKGLSEELHQFVWQKKQEYTAKLFQSIEKDEGLITIFSVLKMFGYKIGVASNSIRETLDTCLSRLGIAHLVDVSMSNEDTPFPKPDPAIYDMAMKLLDTNWDNAVIYEDSEIGLKAARSSWAQVVPVKNRSDLTMDLILIGRSLIG